MSENVLNIKEARARQVKERLTKKAFANLLLVSIAEKLAYFFNPFIDSAITGVFLNEEIQAAIGFFVPIITIISLVWIIIIGVQVLCAQYRGKGDNKSMRALFDSALVFLGFTAVVVSTMFFFGRAELAALLGAKGRDALVLADYIEGYSFSILGQALYPLLLWFLNFNGNDKISKTSIAIMVALNFTFDMLFAVHWGMGAFGLGLATSLSYLLTCAYVFREFLLKHGWGERIFPKICWRELFEAAKIGKPSLTFNIGVTLKSYIMNLTLLSSVGAAAIMVMSVQGTLCGILGAIPAGHVDAFASTGGVYYAAKDRAAFIKSARFALKSCIIFSIIAMLILMLAADDITEFYFKPNEEAWRISIRMLWLFPSFLVLNGICNIFLRSYNLKEEYRLKRKDAWLVDGMPIFENVTMALLAAATMPLLGSDAVWLSFPATELICIAIIACTVFKNAGGVTFKLNDWLKAKDDEVGIPTLERSFNSVEEATGVAKEVVDFCKTNRVEEEIATMAGIVTEELTNNVLIHGAKSNELYSLSYIRITLDESLYIRVYDDNPEFNPLEEMNKLESKPKSEVEEKIGLRLVKSITDRYGSFDYQNTAGINTSIVEFRGRHL